MKLDWKVIGEIVAILSIVVSLIFVGLEIRENSAIARSERYNEFSLAVSNAQLEIALDPVMSALVRKATFSGNEDLQITAEESFRLVIFYQSALRIWEGMYKSVNEGILSNSDLEVVENYAGMLRNTVFKNYWVNGGRNQFLPGFSDFIDAMLE